MAALDLDFPSFSAEFIPFTKDQLHYTDLLNSHNTKQIQGFEHIQFSTM